MNIKDDKQFVDIFNKYIEEKNIDVIEDNPYDDYHYITYNDKDGNYIVDVFIVKEDENMVYVVGDYQDGSDEIDVVTNVIARFDKNREDFRGEMKEYPYFKESLTEQEDYENINKNQLETEIDRLNIELENLKREKEQKYEELKNSEYDEELNKEIKELEEKLKQKQDEINNKESLLTKQTTNNKIDDLKDNINSPETNEPVTESVEDFKEDNFENKDYWKFLNLIKNYYESKPGVVFQDSIQKLEEDFESTLLVFVNGNKIITLYVVDEDDSSPNKSIYVLEKTSTFKNNGEIKNIIKNGNNVNKFNKFIDNVFKVEHKDISNFEGNDFVDLNKKYLNYKDLTPITEQNGHYVQKDLTGNKKEKDDFYEKIKKIGDEHGFIRTEEQQNEFKNMLINNIDNFFDENDQSDIKYGLELQNNNIEEINRLKQNIKTNILSNVYNIESELPKKDKEFLKEKDDFSLIDEISNKLINLIVRNEQSEGLVKVIEETGLKEENDIYMLFEEQNDGSCEYPIHTFYIKFEMEHQNILEKRFEEKNYQKQEYETDGTNEYNIEEKDDQYLFSFDSILKQGENETLYDLDGKTQKYTDNVLGEQDNTEVLNESDVPEYTDFHSFFDDLSNIEFNSLQDVKEFFETLQDNEDLFIHNIKDEYRYKEIKNYFNELQNMVGKNIEEEEFDHYLFKAYKYKDELEEILQGSLKESKYNKDLNNLLEI